ncbi:glycosyltransferase family 2 protein [Spirosoma sp. 48-14]|uniref:glycosyltransferase family 2 protein n=1 Tax=Spirosoma sp. 48-14 TaxID=1895854 RepID=UPI00095A41F1|nr:glycosyltransferase family 2 protein [Spirosoma sp. 48-14]OJW78848.1 MAG: hypothetical protein BGO59_10255 [Spirosoma sp. 48-14]
MIDYVNITANKDRASINRDPLVSIIIVVYNGVSTIRDSIESVINQTENHEIIIIDGASTDGTLSVLEEYQERLTYLLSEPDSGIYDAMNKGLNIAKGEWIYFLGADDVMLPGIINSMKHILLGDKYALVFGNIKYSNGKVFKSSISLKTILQNTLHHQSAFYRRNLFNDFKFNTGFKILSDYELNLLIYLKKLPYLNKNILIAECMVGGSSFNTNLSLKETNQIRKLHVNKFLNFNLTWLLTFKYYINYVLLRKV